MQGDLLLTASLYVGGLLPDRCSLSKNRSYKAWTCNMGGRLKWAGILLVLYAKAARPLELVSKNGGYCSIS